MYVTYASHAYDTQNLHPPSCNLGILGVILETQNTYPRSPLLVIESFHPSLVVA